MDVSTLAVSATTLFTPSVILLGFISLFPILYLTNFYAHYQRHKAATPWTVKNKVVVITGASSGIGEALAYEFASKGAKLYLCARRIEKLTEIANKCRETYGMSDEDVIPCKVDVTRESDVVRFIETIDANDEKIDCLVLNAGVSMGGTLSSLDDCSAIKETMETNYFGSAMLAHQSLSLLKNAKKPRIVVISSMLGIVSSVPFRTGYTASKCALKGFFESLQNELIDDNIFISIAYPGLVKTEIAKSRLGTDNKDIDITDAMSSEECAKIIVDGAIKGLKEIIPTHLGMISRLIEGAFPDLVSLIAYKRSRKLIENKDE